MDLNSRDHQLDAALRAVAEEDSELSASRAVEARLLAAVRHRARARRRRLTAAALLSAAALFLLLVLPARNAGPQDDTRRVGPSDPQHRPGATTDASEITTDFFPLTYALVPALNGRIVRMQVPRAALQQFGVPAFDTQDRSPTVLADVIVGDDGLARAVRFVRLEGVNNAQEQLP